ncbi:hypothetical protein RAA17_01370 [Komagataeibacter rhaeticus]|nr:hypothetical protein [Komagataeibacter rhaeticus]
MFGVSCPSCPRTPPPPHVVRAVASFTVLADVVAHVGDACKRDLAGATRWRPARIRTRPQ